MTQIEVDSDIGDVNKKNKKTQVTKKSNKTSFFASVIDSSAPPPLELSIDNVSRPLELANAGYLLRSCLLTS
jgi:hypothetical protein